jgi:hypothetical protein
VILVAGEFNDFGMHLDVPGDVGFDPLQGSVGVTRVSPITIASFLTAFGDFGLVSQGLFGATPAQSLIWASIGGLVVGVLSHVLFIYAFVKPQGSSDVKLHEIEGLPAEVITPIKQGSVGEVAFVAQGGRMTMTARTRDGSAVPRGTIVTIEEILGSVALVGPLNRSGGALEATDHNTP